ncbi:MFS transporter [Fictibacillus aquaticus]|uniref:ABM domain-containing protein n=1 Tax=Fictibacillus aquaticus TaxID=2021314 RepID=A0A235F684_9BACL|nr:MFS transporter [Fictibacillus aquaticus]OYD56447.1 hypothetical protein CGZ90_15640 [Fictibacillus aquaticus]
MNDEITVFMEYKIKAEFDEQYKTLMNSISSKLNAGGAADVHWYKAADQDSLYVEFFKVETYSMYLSLKEARLQKDVPVYSKLHEMIDGGAAKLHCWAFIKQNLEGKD